MPPTGRGKKREKYPNLWRRDAAGCRTWPAHPEGRGRNHRKRPNLCGGVAEHCRWPVSPCGKGALADGAVGRGGRGSTQASPLPPPACAQQSSSASEPRSVRRLRLCPKTSGPPPRAHEVNPVREKASGAHGTAGNSARCARGGLVRTEPAACAQERARRHGILSSNARDY